jgi:DNA-directed RNA polymerase specialized sigma24 family protein
MSNIAQNEEIAALLEALIALLVDERESRVRTEPDAAKSELLLADAGLPTPTIARLVRKQPDAVRKTISRARKRPTTTVEDDPSD